MKKINEGKRQTEKWVAYVDMNENEKERMKIMNKGRHTVKGFSRV